MGKQDYKKHTFSSMKEAAAARLAELQKKHQELSEWLLHNTTSDQFLTRLSERNDISVQMEVKRQQKTSTWYHIAPPPIIVQVPQKR